MNNYRTNWLATSAFVVALPGTLTAQDPGINQPGAAGNGGGTQG